ncbi:(d)CMP kinase [Neofamilia massiliensis]|uniref:(d)CMP kinase n=1 Tax=Neofamilia massiliensis TaxID=1673724 RepID=UPI0006BB79EB|nr:(d)CMP kinase [Neofamilia massiliensis]
MQIAIDGPSAAGKSTLAKKLAEKLNIEYLDTGAMYRTLALYFYEENFTNFDDEEELKVFLSKIKIDVRNNKFYLFDRDVSQDIREEEIGLLASKISSYQIIRSFLVEKQQEIAKGKDIVMDGRDVGTVILKNADFKFYLTADVNKRAQRRYKDLLVKDPNADFNKTLEALKKRDHDDMTREHSPLTKATDAIEIDTSHLTIDETIDEFLKVIRGTCNV